MKKMSATMNAMLRFAGFVLASLIFCNITLAEQPPDNVQGNWTIYSTRIQDGQIEVKHVQIEQYGNRITGYFEGPNQSGPIQGEINIHHIRFSTVTRNVLTFMGQIYGDNMSGTYGLHGKHAPWQAQRNPPIAQALPPTPAINYQPVLTPAAASEAASEAAPEPQPAPQPLASSAVQSSAVQGSSNPAPTPAPLSSDQLDALVAPIALYPDGLVAQVLAAATNPDQITYADDWLSQNRNLTGAALGQAVDQQSWDPSVKALTQFPSVLDNLAHNLSWTSSLGQAFANQQSDVMAAVQAMRAKAQAAGTLQSNSQITVTQPASTTIVIQPANPQVVYVPQYNPAVVYGAPVVVPMYVAAPLPVASVGLYFGSGVTIGAAFGGGGGAGFGWGWRSWNVNWGGGGSTIIYNHNTYINNRTWNNTNYNGYHPWANNSGYHPGTDTHYGPHGDYHPNGYYGPNGDFHHDVPGTNPNGQPNGGHNGDHGLIGGNGGVQHPNGTQPHADGSSWGDRGPNGGNNGNHGLIGGNGGVQHAPGYVPTQAQPNGGRNGDHGLIGGNASARDQQSRNDGRENTGNLNRSRMSGDGAANRVESNRGRGSMAGRRPQPHPQMARQHALVQHRPSGGGGGRRR
jgi:hypothetical protein